ncbi:MAG TPA: DUF2784 domain-containing protein [Longimicrobiales bacterium]|nr:DUF2784 domain-containing protein [Longimicrobiales bacterium]
MSLPPSWYGNLATLVVLAHFAFILFVMFGGLLVLRWPRVVWLHIPCFLWGGWIEVRGGVCPLTPLENSLRRAAGESAYAGSFIEHYIVSIIYPTGLTRPVQLALAVGLVVLNAGIYALVLRRRSRERSSEADGGAVPPPC